MRTLVAVTLLLASLPAAASEVISFDDGRSLSIGAGLRPSLSSTSGEVTPTLGLDEAVLALGGEVSPILKAQLNLTATPTPTVAVAVLDAIAEIEPIDELRIWAGYLLPASDRESLSGPFFDALWDPAFVAAYPGSPLGRSFGATAWGRLLTRVRYQLGAFAGQPGAWGPLWAGRVQLDLADPEPGYYASGTYGGERQTLAFGIGARDQAHGAGGPHAFTSLNADVLAESRLGPAGTGSLEGELLYYDLGGAISPALLTGPAGEATIAWRLPWQPAGVEVQPAARYQEARSATGVAHAEVDAGLNVWAWTRALRVSLEGTDDHTRVWTPGAKLGLQILL